MKTLQTSPLYKSIRTAIVVALLVFLFLAANLSIHYINIRTLGNLRADEARSNDIQQLLTNVLSVLKDAETVQRGFQITGEPEYLEPYQSSIVALPRDLTKLKGIVESSPDQVASVQSIEKRANEFLTLMSQALDINKSQGPDAAREFVAKNRGKQNMDELRKEIASLSESERDRHSKIVAKTNASIDGALISSIATTVVGMILLVLAFFFLRRNIKAREKVAEFLVEQDRMKNNFMALLGHELRNPLAAIRNSIDVIDMQQKLPDHLEDVRDIMKRQTGLMIRLADDLLDASRIHYGKLDLRSEPVELTALIQRVVKDIQTAHSNYSVKINCNVPHDEIWIKGDPPRLGQIISNLLHNALKFSKYNGEIDVRLKTVANNHVDIVIHDNGEGIDERTLQTIFEPFSQGHSNQNPSRKGLGLGLSLVRGLVKMHDGKITAHSDGRGKGSIFTITLPCTIKPHIISAAPQIEQEDPRHCIIVIIDDRRDASYPLQRMLELMGHQVFVAQDGFAGLALAEKVKPDVILCDIGLPGGMSGYDVARKIRKSDELQDKVLIAVSGFGHAEAQSEALDAGFDKHLTKPVSLDSLRKIVAAIPCGMDLAASS